MHLNASPGGFDGVNLRCVFYVPVRILRQYMWFLRQYCCRISQDCRGIDSGYTFYGSTCDFYGSSAVKIASFYGSECRRKLTINFYGSQCRKNHFLRHYTAVKKRRCSPEPYKTHPTPPPTRPYCQEKARTAVENGRYCRRKLFSTGMYCRRKCTYIDFYGSTAVKSGLP